MIAVADIPRDASYGVQEVAAYNAAISKLRSMMINEGAGQSSILETMKAAMDNYRSVNRDTENMSRMTMSELQELINGPRHQ